jgi:hypothetical protein
LDIVIHPPLKKRTVLDDRPQLLEHVLVALDSAYGDRRDPTSCEPGVLDEVHTTSDHEIFVKIMTSITKNWAKCIASLQGRPWRLRRRDSQRSRTRGTRTR